MKIFDLLARISSLLARQTPLFITIVAVITFFQPHIFDWVRGNVQSLILGFIMLTMGMTLRTEDFKALCERPFHICIGTAAQFIIMPMVAFALTKVMNLPQGIAIGLILVGCCPGGVSSNIMCYLCKGDVAFSLGITIVSTILAPVMTPFLMLKLAGQTVDIEPVKMFLDILIVTIVPIAIGFVCHVAFEKSKGYAQALRIMPGLSVIGLACIVGGVVSARGADFLTSGFWVFVAVLFHNGLGYLFGYSAGLLARFKEPRRRSIALEVGMQNAGLATVLATRHFPALPEVAIASAVSCVWHSISGALMAGVFNFIDGLLSKSKSVSSPARR